MKFKRKNILIVLAILLLAIGVMSSVAAYNYKGTGFSHNIPDSKYSGLSAQDILSKYEDTDCKVEYSGLCTKVIDGDTIRVDGIGKVRFVGVNTPERGVDGYKVSKNFVAKLCKNKVVGLDIDDSKNQDKYGRTLAVVIVDGKNLNEMLLKEGLAEIMYIPPSEFNPHSWV
ncbi:MAG: thermonuclease family protein [Methanobrevibacter sp.]|uniref:thermonuclease family protein n=1 Tax=Methanobrevibacter sp. TaxID=66852 RepID=UPI0026DF701B|nr:thermonuclease family protein [Methanobrevibacter sp.]MDO5848345.1 thermonuclease family protein [Methanobrevibacter sp.]